MKAARQAVLRDVTREARGQSTRVRLRWRRLAVKEFDAVYEALTRHFPFPVTPEVMQAHARTAAAALEQVDQRYGHLQA